MELTQDQIHGVSDAILDVVFIADRDGTFEYVNRALADLTGYSKAELVGMTPMDLDYPDGGENAREAMEQSLSNEQYVSDFRLLDADGNPRHFEFRTQQLTDEDGTVIGIVGTGRDITDLTAYQQKVEAQRDGLGLLNQLLRHDIRNDLQLVFAYADQLLEGDHVDEEGREYVEKILENAQIAVDLTTTARDLAETMLTDEAILKPLPLRPVLEVEIDEIEDSQATGVVRIDGPIPDVTIVANDMVNSVFRNVLKNAIQHNRSAEPEVAVSATADDDRVTVRIADNGPGVPDELKTEIFGKGKKGLESNGTGIGLYLVNTLVESYGGDVWVEDNDAGGATFVVTFRNAEGYENAVPSER